MFVLPNGDKIWPTVGEQRFIECTDKIIQHQIVQVNLMEIELRLHVKEQLSVEEEVKLIDLVEKSLRVDAWKYHINYVNGFAPGKFEVFRCEIKN